MSSVKQDWMLVKEVPGLLARVEWHGGVSFGTVCPQCYRMLEGPSLEELEEVVCKCGWEARQVVIAFLVEKEVRDVKGEGEVDGGGGAGQPAFRTHTRRGL